MSREKTVIGVELDIYVPDLEVAVEPGQWHWHKNIVAKDWEKHLLCKDKGIKLITIYHYDDATVPFDNCLVTHCDLVSRRNTDKLIEITKKILSEFGLNSDLGTSE